MIGEMSAPRPSPAMLRVLSRGASVQSSTVLLAVAGAVPRLAAHERVHRLPCVESAAVMSVGTP